MLTFHRLFANASLRARPAGARGWRLALALGLAAAAGLADAREGPFGVELNGSGFLTVTAGKVLQGTHDPATDQGYRCPCFISDYAQNGVYQRGKVQIGPDSRLGLQGTASIDGGRYAVTGQVVSRGSRDGRVNLEWLYATAELSGNWTVQVGRKRLPLFLSSEVQDVGYALPWTHLSPQLYGWEAVNYNGASLAYRNAVGDWVASAQVLAGSETETNAGYWRIYNGRDSRTASRWSDITGVEGKLSHGVFDARAVLIQSYTQSRQTSAGQATYSPKAWQRIHGLSFNMDGTHWVGRAEFLYIDRHADYGYDHSQLYALGRRFGPVLAMLSYSRYEQTLNAGPGGEEGHHVRSATLRYELDRSSSLKLQYDRWRDHAKPAFASMHGNADLLSVAYDRVF